MNSSKFSLTLVSLALLAACGGGGGGGGGSNTVEPPPVVTPPPLVLASTIVTSVPASTYSAGSEELAAFNLLNAERERCGFGLLAQNTAIDTAARGHADWLLINGYTGHYQVSGTPSFTGVMPDDRLVNAGYGASGQFQSNAETENDQNGTKTGQGVLGVRDLLSAPYHMLEMIRGYRDVGIGVRDRFDVGLSPNNRFVHNMAFGYKKIDGPQAAALDSVRTYPCEGSTGIVKLLRGENPNPVPGRNLSVSPLGSSIGVVVDIGNTLVITSAVMIKVATGGAITLRAPVMAANDPNAVSGVSYFQNNEGFVSADTPLESNTQYQTTVVGTNSGTPFSRTFTFTTGQ